MTSPAGCANCEFAVTAFNNGNGATLCSGLGGRIVAFGVKPPPTRPAKCPLDTDRDPRRARGEP